MLRCPSNRYVYVVATPGWFRLEILVTWLLLSCVYVVVPGGAFPLPGLVMLVRRPAMSYPLVVVWAAGVPAWVVTDVVRLALSNV